MDSLSAVSWVGGFKRRGGLLAAVALVAVVTSGPARSAESVDQSCTVAPPTVAIWASYSLDQSFSPTKAAISAWEAKFFAIENFDQPLRSRLVYNPLGDPPGGAEFLTSGVVVAEATTPVRASRNKSFWVRFQPTAPAEVMPGVPTGRYSIQIDTPLDPESKHGARIGWWSCAADYQGGAAYHAIHPQGAGEYSRDTVGIPLPTSGQPTSHQPLIRQKHPVPDLQFRVFSPA